MTIYIIPVDQKIYKNVWFIDKACLVKCVEEEGQTKLLHIKNLA